MTDPEPGLMSTPLGHYLPPHCPRPTVSQKIRAGSFGALTQVSFQWGRTGLCDFNQNPGAGLGVQTRAGEETQAQAFEVCFHTQAIGL